MSGPERARGAVASLQAAAYRGAAAWVLLYHRVAAGLGDEPRRTRYSERLGRWAGFEASAGPLVWVHAASVGEVAVAAVLIGGLRRTRSGLRVLLTCNTATGRAAAQTAGADETRYLPLDHPRIVRAVIERVCPKLFIFVETEIWPHLLAELGRRGIPKVMVNARISERSYLRYLRVRAMLRGALGGVELFCVRDPESAARLERLGAPAPRLLTTGDMKFDAIEEAGSEDLLGPLAGGDAVVVAASTREGEEALLLEAFAPLADQGLRLVLAPRHPERARAVSRLAIERGLRVLAWSTAVGTGEQPVSQWQVLVVDSVGQLRGFMKAARGVFVGGTLVPVGGHNLLEPASFGVPVAVGPHLANVRSQAASLAANDALSVVDGPEALSALWVDWLARPEMARANGRRALEAVEQGRGALERTLEALTPYLGA